MDNKHKQRKPYEKPRIVYQKKLEVQAAFCDSAWIAGVQCRLTGESSCIKTRT